MSTNTSAAARDKAAADIECQMRVNRAKADRGELPAWVDAIREWQSYGLTADLD